MQIKAKLVLSFFTLCIFVGMVIISSCSDEENQLTPYGGSPEMSLVKVEPGTFKPSITWVGGYCSVIGVNRGAKAVLDTSLVWLAKTEGNNLRYPTTFSASSSELTDLTDQYGGQKVDSLYEDRIYTYWVMKEEMWNKVSGIEGIQFVPGEEIDENEYVQESDTLIQLSPYSFAATTQQIDVYVNVTDLKFFGKLAEINVSQPVDADGPIITWNIIQDGVEDSSISAIGLVEGGQYDERYILWDLWSLEETDSGAVYGGKNVIEAPLRFGDVRDGTITFNEYPEIGIERDKDYYIWVANENWDGKRFRITKFYAYATFSTW